jgi:hypothetical protein
LFQYIRERICAVADIGRHYVAFSFCGLVGNWRGNGLLAPDSLPSCQRRRAVVAVLPAHFILDSMMMIRWIHLDAITVAAVASALLELTSVYLRRCATDT